MKDYKHIEHMRNLNESLIWERMKRCYDYGYEDGQKEKPQAIYEMKVEEYNKGLNEAWECARKISMPENEGGMSVKALQSIFGKAREIFNCTASEAIAKIKEYEDKQKAEDEIKVGDEVTHDGAKFIVLNIDSQTSVYCLDTRGRTPIFTNIHNLTKTGRHFDAIPEVLKQMNREEDK